VSITQKQQLVKAFTGSKVEALALIQLYKTKQIDDRVFDLSSAEILAQYYRNRNIVANEILKKVKKRVQEEESKFASKLQHHLKVAKTVQGNPENGKMLFTTCLMCHQVGKEGQKIAPPLDGSAHREPEALLTAILNPNAAFEGNFNLFRVTKKDNTSLEGYQVKKDDKGITMAFMGGASTFIPKEEIAKSQFVPGRSFMPTGLIDAYSDEQVADLLAYIKTLK
jgi:putative heme-binding domain-containing protein